MVSWTALRGLVKRKAKMARARNPDKTVVEEQAELVERKLSVSVGTFMIMEWLEWLMRKPITSSEST